MKFLSSLFLLFFLPLFSQDATIIYQDNIGGEGFEKPTHIVKTAARGFLIIGTSNSDASGDKSENSRGNDDAWIVKLDAARNIEWEKTIGGDLEDQLVSGIETEDGGFLLTGWTKSNISGDIDTEILGESDIWLVKLDAFGVIEWQKFLGGNAKDIAHDITKTSDGNFLIGGTSNSNISGEKTENSFGEYDYWMLKIDMQGTILWQKTIGGDASDTLQRAFQTSDGSYMLMGTSNSTSSGLKTENVIGNQNLEDYWVLKLTEDLTIAWDHTIGSNAQDILSSGIAATNGGFLLAGYSKGTISGDKTETVMGSLNRHDYWLVRLEENGAVVWDNTIGGNALDEVHTVMNIPDGNFLIAGHSNSDITGDKEEISVLFDLWLLQLNQNGSITSQSTLGGNAPEFLVSNLILNENNTITTVGYGASEISGDVEDATNGDSDYWFIEIADLLPLTIGEQNIVTEITITPNPAKEYITVRHDKNTIAKITLYNMLGKKVASINNNNTIDMRNLASGVYIAEILVDGKTVIKKCIKE